MIKVNTINRTRKNIDLLGITKTSKARIAQLLPNKNIYMEIIFAGNLYLKKINLKYRQKNMSTNVLSFPQWRDKKSIPSFSLINLGSIVVNASMTV